MHDDDDKLFKAAGVREPERVVSLQTDEEFLYLHDGNVKHCVDWQHSNTHHCHLMKEWKW